MVSILQLIYDGLVFGSIILLAAVGLSLLYGIGNFANFAHGSLLTVGAYSGYVAFGELGLPIYVAVFVAIICTGAIGYVIDQTIFRFNRNSGPISLLILTIGIAFVIRAFVSAIWGNDPLSYQLPLSRGIQVFDVTVPLGGYDLVLALNLTVKSLLIVGFAAAFAVATHLFLTRTKTGIAMRATADNKSLSKVTGIDTDRVLAVTWALSGALAAVGGVFLAVNTGRLYPRMGFDILLVVFAAVILGGIGSPYGAMAGAVIVSVAQSMTVVLPGVGAEYRFAVAFLIMVLTLLLRPGGITGAGNAEGL